MRHTRTAPGQLADTLFSRKQLGELAGLDTSTLIYWVREGLVRPSEGGGGKGQHRRFAYSEVNLAAILMDLLRAGAWAASMRGLADKFHEAMDWMVEQGVTRSTAELYGRLIAYRQEFLRHGQIEIPENPYVQLEDSIPVGVTRERGSREKVRLLSWSQAIKLERVQQGSDALVDNAIRLAESVSEDDWRFRYAYFDLLTTPPPPRTIPRHPSQRFSYFLRHDDGAWTLARDLYDAEAHRRYVAIDTKHLFWTMWTAQ